MDKISDQLILAKIYVSILSERQLKVLYSVVNSHNEMGHIVGTYPLGMYYIYNYPDIFRDHEMTLKDMKDTDTDLIPTIVTITAKYIMKNIK